MFETPSAGTPDTTAGKSDLETLSNNQTMIIGSISVVLTYTCEIEGNYRFPFPSLSVC